MADGLLSLALFDRGFLFLTVGAALLLFTSTSFAALAVALRLRNDRLGRRRERLVNRWEPAMLETLGGAAPPEAIFERVDDGDGLAFLSFLLGYARLLRGDEQGLVHTMARPYLPALLDRIRRGTPESRGNAVLTLARLGMPDHADAVASALADDSALVSMIAARSLFRPGHEAYFPEVLEHLPRFTSWSRNFLASMLSGGGPGAAPLLRRILADSERDPLVRAVASDALRGLNDIPSVSLAFELLSAEKDRELLAGCIRLIEQLGHHAHLEVIRELTESDDDVVRATAVSALAAIGGSPEISTLQRKLGDPSFWVSLEAARGLLRLGATETLERLVESGGPSATLARQVLAE